jgi:anthranilate phosphoribosyltransferase
VSGDSLVDTCGTGGDAVAVDGIPTGTFNVSTVAAFVAAAAGCRVAKHGNRAISSRCGSADVLRILNVPVENTPQEAAQSIEDVGLGFLFAPLFHASLKHAATPRREIGIRTIFNLAGPLTNPAGAHRQVVGVYDAALTTPIAQVLRQLGPAHSLVVHGEDGVDEISVTGPTRVAELRDGHVETYTISPIDFGISAAHPADVRGGDPEHNAELANRVLRGDLGPPRDMVLLNAGAAIYVGGKADSMARGVSLAAECIDAGRALEKLHALQRRAGGTKT